MAWIEFHPSRIKKLKKFSDLRCDLQWSKTEALGSLGSLWGEVLEVCEDGEITGWTPEYLCDLTDMRGQPLRVWESLVKHRWIDIKDGHVFIHDWLDWAGRYLEAKYRTSKPELLQRIWQLHGRVWQETVRRLSRDSPPKGLGQIGTVVVPPDLKPNEKEVLDWLAYKRERGETYKPRGLEALWRTIRTIPPEKRRESVDHSMANNWAGLFQKNGSRNGNHSGYAEAKPGKYQD